MAYVKTDWKARQAINPNKYLKSEETANSVVLINAPDSITVPGTLFTPETMNHMEDGISQAHIDIAAEAQARQAADTTLQNNINAEARSRENADNNLSQAITAETRARNVAIAAEAQACQQRFADLQNQVVELIRLIETNIGPIPSLLWATDDGDYVVTDDGDYIALA